MVLFSLIIVTFTISEMQRRYYQEIEKDTQSKEELKATW